MAVSSLNNPGSQSNRSGRGPLGHASEATDGAPVAREIARAAARCFAARGYDATSVREIVEAAGVTKPTLYYYFGSKEGLAQALLFRPLNELAARLRDVLARHEDPRGTLEAMLEAKFAFCRADPDRARLVYSLFFGPLGSELASDLSRSVEDMDRMWIEATRRCVDQGLIGDDPGFLASFPAAIRGLVVVHTADFLYRNGSLDPGLPARLVRNLLEGFGRTATSSSLTSASHSLQESVDVPIP
jgi:AcrR family transcriptional regulator